MVKRVSQAAKERPSGPPLLKGSDLAKNQTSIKIKILEVKDAPKDFSGIYIFRIKCSLDPESYAPNWTSVKNFAQDFGDHPNQWVGKTVTLNKMLVNNPQTHKQAWGLFYGDIEEDE